MTVLISPFDPAAAGPSVLADYHQLVLATGRVDRPGEQPQSFEAVVSRLRVTLPGRGSARFWAAYQDDHLIGSAEVNYPADDNAHIAFVEVRVHPGHRRRGTGTRLLAATLPETEKQGRSLVLGWGVTDDSAGSAWTTRLGFRPVHRDIVQVLELRAADPERWRCPEPGRYRLVEWSGTAPDELLDSLAHARDAIQDQPAEEGSYHIPQWTAAKIREHEKHLRDNDIAEHVVAAVDRATGEVVGLTELIILANRPNEALQGDTAVLAAHRGHGLGRQVKAAMLRRLVAEHPEVRRILTSTAADNSFMIDVNLGLGFRTVRHMIDVEADFGTLRPLLSRDA